MLDRFKEGLKALKNMKGGKVKKKKKGKTSGGADVDAAVSRLY